MTNQESETAVIILANKAVEAAAHIAITQGFNEQVGWSGRLVESLRDTIKTDLDRVIAEWKEALEANIGEAELHKLIDTQAIELAQKAVEAITVIPSERTK